MNPRAKGILLFLVALLVGTFLGFLSRPFFTEMTAPTAHKTIVSNTRIIETAPNLLLTPHLLSSGLARHAGYLQFTVGKEYQQSIWYWERNGDVEFFMVIWGPADNGRTYGIEFSRAGWAAFKIECAGNVLEISAITESTPRMEGYYNLLIQYP